LKAYEKNNLAFLYPDVAKQWHPELNAPLTPHEVVAGSEKKFYWICSKNHVWEASVYSRTKMKSGCPFCSHNRVYDDISLETLNPALAKFWNTKRNAPLTPKDVTAYSGKRVWWICTKGHEWPGMISSMQKHQPGNECPFCNNRIAHIGNCLSTSNPALAKQWHPEKNGTLTAYDVMPKSNRKVWWKCPICSNEWQAVINSQNSRKTRCSYCAGRRASPEYCLQSICPDLAKEWHPSKNGELTPQVITPKNQKKVWWKCSKGHEWQASVSKRSQRGDGCPYCSGRQASPEYCLQSLYPDVAQEWHPRKNEGLTPQDVTPGSGRRVWWECQKGHEWQTSVHNRSLRGQGCPLCVDRTRKHGSLAEEFPHLLDEWDYSKNLHLPEKYRARSNKKVWWRCSICTHEWQATPDSRVSGSGCPICAREKRKASP